MWSQYHDFVGAVVQPKRAFLSKHIGDTARSAGYTW